MKQSNLCLFSAILILAVFLSGCGEKSADNRQAANMNAQNIDTGNALGQEQNEAEQQEAETAPKPSASATKIYLALMQAGLKEAVVDVQENEVVIGFMEDSNHSNEALAYFSFGIAAKFEPQKEKTSVLIFSPNGKITDASVKNSDTIALSEGKLTEAQYKEKVRRVK